MHIWKAALCVLYEIEDRTPKHYTWIAREIIRRGLSQSRSKKFSQTLGKVMRESGHDHFSLVGGGNYRLRDRSRSGAIYENLARSYPQLLRGNASSTASPLQADKGIAKVLKRAGSAVDRNRPHAFKRTATPKYAPEVDVSGLIEQLIAEQVPSSFEGERKQIYINAFERKQEARKFCIQAHGYSCAVCTMRFDEEFGDIGKGFIHVHHILPLSKSDARLTNPINDLCPVCPNCHAMLHRGESIIGRAYFIDELRDIRQKAKRRISERRRRKKRLRKV